MIFVTVGTQKFQMNLLLQVIDDYVEKHIITEPVFAQTGHSNYQPKNYEWKPFLGVEEFEAFLGKADLVITHGGVTTILKALQMKKKVIVVPRSAARGEHVDDHQLQIADIFEKKKYLIVCKSPELLKDALRDGKELKAAEYIIKENALNNYLDDYIRKINMPKKKDKRLKVLMVGVDSKRPGGMWTVAENYLSNPIYQSRVDVSYVATNTYGSIPDRLAAMLAGYIKILWILLTGHTDLVHIHMAEKGSAFRKGIVVYMAHLFGKKVIVQMHAGPFMAWYETIGSRRKQWILNMLSKTDMVCVLGDYWKEQMELLVPGQKLKVLYNGSYYPPENPYNPDGKKILYLGILKKEKGTFDLLKAMSLINDQMDPDIELCLCGIPEEDGVEEKIREYHLENRVKLLGWISGEQKLDLFKDAELCVHPSWYEGLSMTVLEAACYGIPVITVNISTMPEILGPDIEMAEVRNPESLSALIMKWAENRELRLDISGRLYTRAGKLFSIEQNIKNTLLIYEQVMNGEKHEQ